MKIKPLVWHKGGIGVFHEYADGAGGRYHVWGEKTWAGPDWRRGNEPNYAPDAKAAANAAHQKALKKFMTGVQA